jgi:cell division protein ZapE
VTHEPQTVGARWRSEIAARRLQFDASQQEAAVRLDQLADGLRRERRAWLDGWRLRLGWKKNARGSAPPRGLYLWGGVGRGKTLLMDAFFASLGPVPSERTHFYRFMRGVHQELVRAKGRENPLELVAQRIAGRARALCLDEFMVADIADAMILSGLLDGLFRHGVTLIATSNVPPQDLYQDGLQRQRFLPAIALIETHLDVIRVDSGVDYRLRYLERAPTYLDCTSPHTPQALRQRFQELAGGGGTAPARLVVEGRPIHAVATGPDIAWFEFSELCEGPRSQNDYIDLARLYGTVFVANVPVFTPSHEDAARRFIMLVDEFYDRGVKTVVSAAAPPGELYRGERLRFEFQRAASRLVEMQTPAYLAGRHHA